MTKAKPVHIVAHDPNWPLLYEQEKQQLHIHMMAMSERFENHILFRDALRNDESLRRQYAQLKQRLACQLSQDREYYTEQKGAFIKSVLAQQQ